MHYRATIYSTPSEANLRRAYLEPREIKARIKSGTFDFDEGPDYRCKVDTPVQQADAAKTCNGVFKERVAMNDLACSTFEGYRKIPDALWAPKIGETPFEKVTYSELAKIATSHTRK